MTTDAAGAFTVYGVDGRGLMVRHDSYRSCETGEGADDRTVTVRLVRGDTLAGVVRDPDGRPVAGARITAGERRLDTDAEGRYALAGLGPEDEEISCKANGFVNSKAKRSDLSRFQGIITLARLPEVRGRILDAAGAPMADAEVWIGPGRDPADWNVCRCRSETSGAFVGRYRIDQDYGHEGVAWIGVRGPGGIWAERRLSHDRLGEGQEIRLPRGGTLTGRVATERPESLRIRLFPAPLPGDHTNAQPTARQHLGLVEGRPAADGAFRLSPLPACAAVLTVAGKGTAPLIRFIAGSPEGRDRDLDSVELSIAGCGTVVGQIVDEKDPARPQSHVRGHVTLAKPWNGWAPGFWEPFDSLCFTTDQDGRYRCDGVPAGAALVHLPKQVLADVIGSDTRPAWVGDGQTATADFWTGAPTLTTVAVRLSQDAGHGWGIADGSISRRMVDNVTTRRPLFRIEAAAAGTDSWLPVVDWEEADEDWSLGAPGIPDGSWRLRIHDWQGSRGRHGLLMERAADLGPGRRQVAFALGGSSLTGRARIPADARGACVVALGPERTVRWAHTDDEGDYCLRFLPSGVWRVIVRLPQAGWTRLAPVTVQDDARDLGEVDLAAGATLTVRLPAVLMHPPYLELRGVDGEGFPLAPVSLTLTEQEGEIVLPHCWPGAWSLALTTATGVVARAQAVVEGNIPVTVTLADAAP